MPLNINRLLTARSEQDKSSKERVYLNLCNIIVVYMWMDDSPSLESGDGICMWVTVRNTSAICVRGGSGVHGILWGKCFAEG